MVVSEEAVVQIVLTEMQSWNVGTDNEHRWSQLHRLSERLIRYFSLMNIGRPQPTTEMVSEIVLTELKGWRLKDAAEKRREQLYALASRLIAYSDAFACEAAPAVLPGLPGGAAL